MAKKKGGLKEYKAYPMPAGRDPIMDWVLRKIEAAEMTDSGIEKEGGPASGTIKGWRTKTRRPQFTTIAAATRAAGIKTINLDEVMAMRLRPRLRVVKTRRKAAA